MGQTESSETSLDKSNIQTREGVLQFTVNGKSYTVDKDVTVNTRLASFLRNNLGLTGTKTVCWEGGCGACVVTLSTTDPVSGQTKVSAVNSCLVPLLQCHGSQITTVEGIGNKKKGYHPVQTKLADFNGTQCGYCSPGMVMSMYSFLEKKKDETISPAEVENVIDGHLCRCTGYRPIIDAFKTFSTNPSSPVDIEELGGIRQCKKGTGPCKKAECSGNCPPKQTFTGKVALADGTWERPENLAKLLSLLNDLPAGTSYKLVAGNTGIGLYKNDGPFQNFYDISAIPELQQVSVTTPLTIGGCVALSKVKETLESIGSTNPDYWYGSIIAEHIGKIAGSPVRNMATVAGNLMLKHAHPSFTSDLVILLETIGATLLLNDATGTQTVVSISDFLTTDMSKKVIISVYFPPISNDHVIRTFKIMPRANNATAYINAGFRMRVDRQDNFLVLEKPTIVYGGISPSFMHADVAESYLAGKYLGDQYVLQSTLQILSEEIVPVEDEPKPDPTYRKDVALGLFYKVALDIVGDRASAVYRSGATNILRGLSKGQQTFDPDSSEGPLYKPIPKVEARAQTAGEAEFFDDVSPQNNELYAVFVQSTVANCTIDSIDPSAALAQEGVVAFYDAQNVPGNNVCIEKGANFDIIEDEEVFCSSKVLYAGQPLGLIVARSHEIALRAAKLVSVKYKDAQKPILTIKDAMLYPDRVLPMGSSITFTRTFPGSRQLNSEFKALQNRRATKASVRTIEGEFEMGMQFHFYMEMQFTRCVPTEDGIQVYCGTYDMDITQKNIAKALGIRANQIEMQVRRLGGSFGGKYVPAMRVAVTCAIAAYNLNQPVRMKLDLYSNMEFVGGRMPHYCKYKAVVDDTGLLQSVEMDVYADAGCNFNESYVPATAYLARNCYKSANWRMTPYTVKTDTAKHTYCRGPGPTEGVALIENIMEHIARELGQDPLAFRLKNLNDEVPSSKPGAKTMASSVQDIVNQLIASSSYETRKLEVEAFNTQNRWKKRGISVVPMVFEVSTGFPSIWYNCLVAIYHTDGTVVVTHGGIESGQGINTKVAQVVARELDIPIELVSVKATNTLTNPNTYVTGGSLTSELNCYGAMVACKELVERMKPIRDTLVNPDWLTLVQASHMANIDLTARHYVNPANDQLTSYIVYGATVTEVELDVLTGEHVIRRVDVLEDAGHSLNPLVDVGQVEGAFIMGLGLWTTEKAQYNKITGKKLTVGTSYYKPPVSKDIPVDFRVTLLKNSINPDGVLGCKATGEPALCMSISVLFALKSALEAARKEAGIPGWFRLDGPATIDVLQKQTLTDFKQFLYTPTY